nr:metallopeptidase family protein [Tessaracoccus coleopterorum]
MVGRPGAAVGRARGGAGRKAQIVIFERPLEHRAGSRSQLRDLVHQTIVEQLSALTGRSIEELGGDPGWD